LKRSCKSRSAEASGSGDDAVPAPPGPPAPRLRDTPEDIPFEATPNAIALHPARPLLAAGDCLSVPSALCPWFVSPLGTHRPLPAGLGTVGTEGWLWGQRPMWWQGMSQNSQGWQGALRTVQSKPLPEQGHPEQDGQGSVQAGLNLSREGDSTPSLGSLFQGSATFTGKKLFLML
uniref:Uncharacterized protein n=1 Tax=Calidris pygmaea TaxID=425635 RepID=A0A8C3JM81_9CHAR